MAWADPKDGFIHVLGKAWESLHPSNSCANWAESYFHLPQESSSTGQSVIRLEPAQASLLDILAAEDTGTRHVVLKSSRTGFSTIIQILSCYMPTVRAASTLIYQSTDTEVRDFCKQQVEPALRDCPETRQHLENLSKGEFVTGNYVIGGNLVMVKSSNAQVNFRRTTADTVILDELSSYRPNVAQTANTEGQGSVVSLAERACLTSPNPRLIMGSSPISMEECLTRAEYEKTKLKLCYFVQCKHCGEYDPIRWSGIKFPGPDDGDDDYRSSKVRYECWHCKGLHKFRDVRKMTQSGFWACTKFMPDSEDDNPDTMEPRDDCEQWHGFSVVADRQRPPFLISPEGDKVKFPSSVGFCWNLLTSTRFGWDRAVQRFLESKDDPRAMKAWTSLIRGVNFVERDNRITEHSLKKALTPMKLLSEKIKVIVCAVDVQEVYLSAWIFGFTGDGEIHAIYQQDFLGHTEHVESMSYRSFLDWLASKPTWARADNVKLPIDQVIIDCGYRTKVLYQLYPRIPIRTKILCRGIGTPSAPASKKVAHTQATAGIAMIAVGTIQVKMALVSLVAQDKLFVNDEFTKEQYEQFGSEKRIKVRCNRTGRLIPKFVKITQAARNEGLDGMVYAYAAISATQPLFDTIRPTAKEVGALSEQEKATIKYLRKKQGKSAAKIKQGELAQEAYAAMGSRHSKLPGSELPQVNLFDD